MNFKINSLKEAQLCNNKEKLHLYKICIYHGQLKSTATAKTTATLLNATLLNALYLYIGEQKKICIAVTVHSLAFF